MAQLRAHQTDLCLKLRVKHAATEALPFSLRGAAILPDFTPFPARRTMPFETPPLVGFMERKAREAAEVVRGTGVLGGQKRR